MPRTLQPRSIPCTVPGCRFLGTSTGGLSNHRRWHAAELRRIQRREHARNQRATRDNTADDSDWNHPNLGSQDNGADDRDNNGDNNGEEVGNHRNPSTAPQGNHDLAEDVQYHPIINGLRAYTISNE